MFDCYPKTGIKTKAGDFPAALAGRSLAQSAKTRRPKQTGEIHCTGLTTTSR